MVAGFTPTKELTPTKVELTRKELLSRFLITVKLRETVASAFPKLPAGVPALEFSERSRQELQKLQQTPSDSGHVIFGGNDDILGLKPPADSVQVVIKGDSKNPEEGSKQSETDWVVSIQKKLKQAREDNAARSRSKLCIYKVPHYLREEDDKAIVPQVVSLGPYHHGKKRLCEMERHKWRSLHQVLKRNKQDLKLYLDSVRELEESARSCYQELTHLTRNKFVEMMVLDGCFVLELFRGVAAEGFEKLGYRKNDPIFAMRGSMHSIQRDMIMIENQLPLFILDRLLGLQRNKPDQTVAQLAVRFFDPLMPTDEPLSENSKYSVGYETTFDPLSDLGALHCLDIFRRSLLRIGTKLAPEKCEKRRSPSRRVADKRRQQMIHCATELKEAGIKFEKRETDRFWDIQFKNGVLMIPRLWIHDGTRSLFLNLIAFEQCHFDCRNEIISKKNDITSYVIFLDNLINSPEDVAYLHSCGIIEHWLGSDAEVADLFNRLCQEVVFDINDSYLCNLSAHVNSYYNNKWNAWRATLKHKYFSNPWAIISLFAAVVLLLLTYVQTFYGVYAYYRPSS